MPWQRKAWSDSRAQKTNLKIRAGFLEEVTIDMSLEEFMEASRQRSRERHSGWERSPCRGSGTRAHSGLRKLQVGWQSCSRSKEWKMVKRSTVLGGQNFNATIILKHNYPLKSTQSISENSYILHSNTFIYILWAWTVIMINQIYVLGLKKQPMGSL